MAYGQGDGLNTNKVYGHGEFTLLRPNKTYNYEQGECCGIRFDKPHGRLLGDGSCADPSYKLVCEGNKIVLYLYYGRHRVQVISVNNSSSLRSVSAGVDHDNCSTIAVNPISYNNFTDASLEKLKKNVQYDPYYTQDSIAFLSCKNPVSSLLEGSAATCTRWYDSSTRNYTYVLFRDAKVSEYEDVCSIDMIVNLWLSALMTCNENCSNPEVWSEQLKWLELRFIPIPCGHWDEGNFQNCKLKSDTNLVLCLPLQGITFAKEMFAVIFFCSCDRPSMSKVIEMLECVEIPKLPPSEPLLAWQ
ncbi:hypothetical protein L6164_036847 [Bauhinia variegata]|uniref:Uncharacterized protein n=1 Tax=Bauhinia variegata TaxID=167791 RepID=A0ACB9KII2_BAUVA|nr:hypothetical protein L6164_036847 [Bauhinia variegata]